MALLSLPTDILRIIMSHLSTRDALSTRVSCRQLLALSQVDILDISLKTTTCDTIVQLSSRLSSSFAYLKTLVLSNIAKGASYASLSQIITAISPLFFVQRLVLLDIPVHELRPMRKLQLIQKWESFREEGGQRPWSDVEMDFVEELEARLIPWEGCSWFFHPLSKLKSLKSLEIKLVPAIKKRKGLQDCRIEDDKEDEEEEEDEEVMERLILGQAAMIGSLASLHSISKLRHLSIRLIDGIDLTKLRSVQAQYGLGEEASDQVDNWAYDEEEEGEGSEDESESDSSTGNEEADEVLHFDGVEIKHDDPTDSHLPSFLLPLSAAMSHLHITSLTIHNNSLPAKSLIALTASVPALESLIVKSSLVHLSHRVVQAIAGLSRLETLELSSVRLVYTKGDADDCPEQIMTQLYASLGSLPSFSALKFDLDKRDNMHFMHSAYLMGLCEDGAIEENLRSAGRVKEEDELQPSPSTSPSPSLQPGFRQNIRDLSLSLVILDSDYTLMILGSLVNLNSLNLVYQTWPLSLNRNDLSLLAPLSSLTSLKLSNVFDENSTSEDFLLALTSKSLQALMSSMQSLKTLHYSGPFLLDEPSLPFDLSANTSITDLSLKQVLPLLLQLPRFPLCLPASLVNLSLSRVRLSPDNLSCLGKYLSSLHTLTLEEFHFGYESLLALLTSDESLRQRLTLLAVSSTLRSPSLPPSRSHLLPYLQQAMEPELWSLSRLSCKMLGRFRSLQLLLLAPLPPLPSLADEQGPDLLLYHLGPSLSKLRGLTLQAPHMKGQGVFWSQEALEKIIKGCSSLRSLHISDGRERTSSLRPSLPYL